ncbi:MAG TPA: fatty acid desaturase, partial [Paracoccus sp. (in: a-proteobacteria)]|nr:fatty acid desaturase [Paracoccus sp. (in: a-proteobacteria)]
MKTAFRSRFINALPFWLSLGMIPMAAIAVARGGFWFMLLPSYAWYITTILDKLIGLNEENPDPETPENQLFWYRAITIIWFPLQAATIFGAIWYVTRSDYSFWEQLGLFWGLGIVSGTIGIVYAHELMHQKNALERWLGDLLMTSTLYGHFRSEHLLVHHSWVATPRDLVSARYGQGFWHYFWAVLTKGPGSAWQAETRKLARA